jgi:phospholipid transport system transporter-binding protein
MFKTAASLTMDNAGETLAAGLQAIAAGESAFDLSGLVSVDSSAVAAMLAWQRQAQQTGRSLHFGVLPANLQSLIALYGATDLFPVTDASPAIADIRQH